MERPDRRWEGDERGRGIGDGEWIAPTVARLLDALGLSDWVAEEPDVHLLPHLRRACALPGSPGPGRMEVPANFAPTSSHSSDTLPNRRLLCRSTSMVMRCSSTWRPGSQRGSHASGVTVTSCSFAFVVWTGAEVECSAAKPA